MLSCVDNFWAGDLTSCDTVFDYGTSSEGKTRGMELLLLKIDQDVDPGNGIQGEQDFGTLGWDGVDGDIWGRG